MATIDGRPAQYGISDFHLKNILSFSLFFVLFILNLFVFSIIVQSFQFQLVVQEKKSPI